MQKESRRRMPRQPVLLPASVGGTAGMIRDINPWGVFFAPQGGLDHRASDTVQLALNCSASVLAKVRWSGWSSKHGCAGLGLEYVAAPAALVGPRSLQEVK